MAGPAVRPPTTQTGPLRGQAGRAVHRSSSTTGPAGGKAPARLRPYAGRVNHLTDDDVRTILRAHRDGGPLSRLYATGETTSATVPAIGMAAADLEDDGRHQEADPLWDVLEYVTAVGDRPPVTGWTGKV